MKELEWWLFWGRYIQSNEGKSNAAKRDVKEVAIPVRWLA
jgi:hypothetical protein